MRKRRLLSSIVVFVSLGAPLAAAAQSDYGAHNAGTIVTKPEAAMSEGVIRKIDKLAGEVTIAHGPLVNLGMPKMTMTFRLKTSDLIEGVKEGSKVRFVAANLNGQLTVIALQAVK